MSDDDKNQERISKSNHIRKECPKCKTENVDLANFCSNCGEKIEKDSFVKEAVDSNSNIILEIKGGYGEVRHNYIVIKEDVMLIGKGKVFGSKVDYTEIKYEDIRDIGLKLSDRDLANINIEIKNRNTKINGFKIEDAANAVRLIKNILSGNTDLLNSNIVNEIKTDEIPIYPGEINKSYLEYGLIEVRADSSLFS